MKTLLALSMLCAASLPALAAEANKINAQYSVSRAGQPIGEINDTLQLNQGQYQLESTTMAVGVVAVFVKEVITQISLGHYDAEGFHPQQFQYLRSTKPQKNLDARFDWKSKTATFHYDGKTETQPLPAQLQDRLSLGYQLRYWPKDLDSQTLPVSNGKTIHEYFIKREGEEMLSVPAGKFNTTRYTRERTKEQDGITVWVSPQAPVPIKIVVEEKRGAVNEQVLTRLTSE